MKKPIVYIACSVTNASREFELFVSEFKKQLRLSSDALVMEWIKREDHISIDNFYQRDFNNVRKADVMIALVDEPSIGLGMELQEAINLKRPLLCMHRADNDVSRLLASAAEQGVLPLKAYENINDAAHIAADFIASMSESTVSVDYSSGN